MAALIGILSGALIYLSCSILYDITVGSKGPRGFLKRYYDTIRGNRTRQRKMLDWFMNEKAEQQLYNFDGKKYMLYAIPVCLGIFIFTMLFFRSWTIALFLSLIGLLYPRYIVRALIAKRRKQLNSQLRDAMFSLTSSLRAGVSLQRSIERSAIDLERIYHKTPDAPIIIEFRKMAEEISMGYSIEEVMTSFRDRARMEDIDDFVNATLLAHSRGGNLTEIMGNVSRTISDKIEIKQEIGVLTAGKRMEAGILSVMPIGIVLTLSLLSPEYMEPMYETLLGRILLMVGVLLIAINYFVSRKIIDINV